VDTILKTALDNIMLGQGEPADVLPAANEEINALFQ
jgi:ABC-type glycerol-3-phosphate transport system substrate-binding protein